jgi:cell division septation protein DedD
VLYGFWHYVGRDYVALRREAQRQADGVTPPPPTAPQPAGEPLRYSVAIEAHPDLPTAAARVESLTAAEPAMGFYIAPILNDNELYYRVLAGPVRDSAAAAVLMDSLVARRHKTGSSEWDIRSTPYTFLLDEFATRDSAEARMSELRGLDIPAYVVEIPYTAGPSRYRLYSGAYSGPAEAELMRQLLRNTGLADTLVLRTGRTSS